MRVTSLSARQRISVPQGGDLNIHAAGLGALQVDQCLLDLPHGLAHPALVGVDGPLVVGLSQLHLSEALAAVKQGYGHRQRTKRPGIEPAGHPATEQSGRANAAVEGQPRVTLCLRAAHLGPGDYQITLGGKHIGTLGECLGRNTCYAY